MAQKANRLLHFANKQNERERVRAIRGANRKTNAVNGVELTKLSSICTFAHLCFVCFVDISHSFELCKNLLAILCDNRFELMVLSRLKTMLNTFANNAE